jgi:hypothetical protein
LRILHFTCVLLVGLTVGVALFRGGDLEWKGNRMSGWCPLDVDFAFWCSRVVGRLFFSCFRGCCVMVEYAPERVVGWAEIPKPSKWVPQDLPNGLRVEDRSKPSTAHMGGWGVNRI